MNPHFLPDPRPYPAEPVKNELLLHAAAIAGNRSRAQCKLSQDTLHSLIFRMLQSRQLTALSVALNMAPSDAVYRILWQAMEHVLQPRDAGETGWIVLPVVLVAGCNQPLALPTALDAAALNARLAESESTRLLAPTVWLPALLSAEHISRIRLEQWFAAKQDIAAAEAFAAGLDAEPNFAIPAGQSVHVLYALGYGEAAAPCPLGKAALPLMQHWQRQLAAPGLTLFANPLDAAAPLSAIAAGSHMRQRMALEVFAANAIRSLRLQSRHVGVVMAAEAGGCLAFGFGDVDCDGSVVQQVFRWHLSPADAVDEVVRDFLHLLAECRIEHIRLLRDTLPEDACIPDYAQALNLDGFNPLSAPAVQ